MCLNNLHMQNVIRTTTADEVFDTNIESTNVHAPVRHTPFSLNFRAAFWGVSSNFHLTMPTHIGEQETYAVVIEERTARLISLRQACNIARQNFWNLDREWKMYLREERNRSVHNDG